MNAGFPYPGIITAGAVSGALLLFMSMSSCDRGASGSQATHPEYGRATEYELPNHVVIAIPPNYQFPRPPAQSDGRPYEVDGIQFQFFLPSFTGYVTDPAATEFDPNKVVVTEFIVANPDETKPDAPGAYVPNMKKRALAAYLDTTSPITQYDLTCYREKNPYEQFACFGKRTNTEEIMLQVDTPNSSPVMKIYLMRAEYYSSSYGGMEVRWRTQAQNLPRWREIDEQIWKFVDQWKTSKHQGS